MILDHIAYRVTNRKKAAGFLAKTLKYTTNTEFEIVFDNKSTAECLVLEPNSSQNPEIFISDGTDNSVVGEWVQAQNGSGGIHHIAYRVSDIYAIVQEWKENGVQFLTEDVIDCPEDNMKQIFSKPLDILGGLIIELIERQDKGFCQNSVKDLMTSTQGIK
jgi:4-hydroxyphenylpyruvate dioxygenase-like putative hemolysin